LVIKHVAIADIQLLLRLGVSVFCIAFAVEMVKL